MDDAIRKAEALVEALGFIRTFRGRLTVIKLGGSAMEEADALRATLQSVVFLETVGMHSNTLQALFGERMTLPDPGGRPIDLGRVGEVTRVDAGVIADFAGAGVVPVIPSLAHDAGGGWLNVNADTAACAVAANLKAAKLVMLTDTPGILRDPKDPGSLISHLDSASCRRLVTD